MSLWTPKKSVLNNHVLSSQNRHIHSNEPVLSINCINQAPVLSKQILHIP